MSIGNFFTGLRGILGGVTDVAKQVPVIGDQIKGAQSVIGNVGGALEGATSTQSNAPATYNKEAENTQDSETPSPSIGNIPGMQKEGAAGKGEAAAAENAAKTVAAQEASAEEIAAMLV